MWLQNHGLAPFGFVDIGFIGHCQMLCVWGFLRPMRWEVWYHGVCGVNAKTRNDFFAPLPPGSRERYHRINLSADRLWQGDDAVKGVRTIFDRSRRAQHIRAGV